MLLVVSPKASATVVVPDVTVAENPDAVALNDCWGVGLPELGAESAR